MNFIKNIKGTLIYKRHSNIYIYIRGSLIYRYKDK